MSKNIETVQEIDACFGRRDNPSILRTLNLEHHPVLLGTTALLAPDPPPPRRSRS